MATRALLVVAGVYVNCPHCGTGQENPGDGSYLWSPEQLAAVGTFLCQNHGCVRRVDVGSAKSAKFDR